MEIFYEGWNVVKKFLNADARLPKEREMPLYADRFVCKDLESRRDYPVVAAIESFNVVKQPDLLKTEHKKVSLHTNKFFVSCLYILSDFPDLAGTIASLKPLAASR